MPGKVTDPYILFTATAPQPANIMKYVPITSATNWKFYRTLLLILHYQELFQISSFLFLWLTFCVMHLLPSLWFLPLQCRQISSPLLAMMRMDFGLWILKEKKINTSSDWSSQWWGFEDKIKAVNFVQDSLEKIS